MSTYTVSVLINGNASGYKRATQEGERATRSFVSSAQREFSKLKQFMQSYHGQLAGLGLSAGFIQMQKNAGQLEKSLTQVRLTAGMSAKEQMEAYREMFAMVKRNGGVIEETVGGFNSLVQAGLKYKEAIKATEAINLARAVTGANDASLAGALTVGASSFNFDLSQVGVATGMLDKMTVAGRLGTAELEQLSNIFPRVAQGAMRAGMSFDKTLAFVEALSQGERQPERLATLADSTLRLFTNAHYSKDAEKALGVSFFDKSGGRRDPITVLEDMRKKYRALTTDAQRFQFVNKAFGKADLDTQRGLTSLLTGKQLEDIRDFERQIKNASGTLQQGLATATNNAVDQASRLKNTLRESAEGFARPINDTFARAAKYLLDSKAQGGLGLSGGQIAGGAAAGALGVYALSRLLPPVLGNLVGRGGGVAAGVASGKALQAAAGVTPVYVTNWAEMGGGAGGLLGTGGAAAAGAATVSVLSKLRNMAGVAALLGNAPVGVAGLGATAAGVGVAGLAGYGVGTGLYKMGLEGNRAGDGVGELIARALALFGNEEAARSVALNDALKNTTVGGEVTVRVLGDPNVAVQAESKPFNGTRMRTDVGQTNRSAGL